MDLLTRKKLHKNIKTAPLPHFFLALFHQRHHHQTKQQDPLQKIKHFFINHQL